MNKKLEEAKKKYDGTEIPEEYSKRVEETVAKMRREHQQEQKKRRRKGIYRGTFAGIGAVAASFVLLLNTSVVFASEMQSIPVLGAIAKVLTFRSYETTQDDIKISVEIPNVQIAEEESAALDAASTETPAQTETSAGTETLAPAETLTETSPAVEEVDQEKLTEEGISLDSPSLETIREENKTLADSVNEDIYRFCTQYAQEAIQVAEDYRTAFLETGGTEEEWKQHNIEIKVWYEIKAQTENTLSFIVSGAQNWSSAYSQSRYYNLDLQTGSQILLKDLLGEDYVSVIQKSVEEQIPAKEEQLGMEFWDSQEITAAVEKAAEENRFYMNENGNPVVVFEKYEIAPGAAGSVEFEIPKQ